MFDALLKLMIMAQSATPDIPIKFEPMNPTDGAASGGGLGPAQWAVLIIYAFVCIGLIVGVVFQTSKSEGLLQSSMSAPTQPYKGKKSAEDRMSQMTTYCAYSFLGLSILMAVVFRG